jgi:hypothetical protein
MSNDDDGDNDLARQKRERGFKQEDERFAKAEAARLEWACARRGWLRSECGPAFAKLTAIIAASTWSQ